MTQPPSTDHFAELDQIIHVPARLRLVTQLYVVESADATLLVNTTGLTWGNLATHLRKLEESGYVIINKGYQGRKPHTVIALSTKGRQAFDTYRATMRAALDQLPDSRS
jgi:DNA-binding MarR family transcriptional regulator